VNFSQKSESRREAWDFLKKSDLIDKMLINLGNFFFFLSFRGLGEVFFKGKAKTLSNHGVVCGGYSAFWSLCSE